MPTDLLPPRLSIEPSAQTSNEYSSGNSSLGSSDPCGWKARIVPVNSSVVCARSFGGEEPSFLDRARQPVDRRPGVMEGGSSGCEALGAATTSSTNKHSPWKREPKSRSTINGLCFRGRKFRTRST